MALSNWDTLAMLIHNHQPCDGTFTSPSGILVELYKNWLYIHDPKAWTEDSRYCHPVVMEIQEGILTYKDVEIRAFRGPQKGVYVVCTSYDPKNAKNFDRSLGMIGCGVYGFTQDEEAEWIGVTAGLVSKETSSFGADVFGRRNRTNEGRPSGFWNFEKLGASPKRSFLRFRASDSRSRRKVE